MSSLSTRKDYWVESGTRFCVSYIPQSRFFKIRVAVTLVALV